MNWFQGQRGYTLFLTILMIVIFSILSVTLITTTLSGAKRSEVREDVTQAGELAEKGLKHITSQINNDLNEKLAIGGRSKTDFKVDLLGVLNTYECVPNTKIIEGDGPTGSYEACVEGWKDSADNPLQKEVTISSTGISTDKEKTLETILLIGAEEAPVPLKYALSSTKSLACEEDPNECLDGEGNMFLHGGISVEGDVKIDGNLIVSDMAYTPARADDYLFKEVYWLDSVLPELSNTELELGGEIYKYNVPKYLSNHVIGQRQSKYNEIINAYNEHTGRKSFDGLDDYEVLTEINRAFYNNKGPILEEKKVFQESININNTIEQMKYTNKDSGVVEINSAGFKLFEGHRTFKNINSQNLLYGFYCAKGLIFECALNLDRTYSGKFYLVGNNNNVHRFAVKKDLHIGRELVDVFNETIKVNIQDKNDKPGGIYVGKDLTIGRGLTSNLEAATSDPNIKVEIDGNMYVDGDLVISGVDGKFNSIIYVNGDVTIERSKFSGLKKDGKEGHLIIFANGKIDFVKNQLFRDNYNTLEGFYYSKEKIEVFGSASNFKIKGGLSAPKIVLNGIRGKAGIGGLLGVIKAFEPSQHKVFGYYDTVQNQSGKQSRLQVEYDSSLLESYSDLSIDDHVYNVISPVMLERVEK